MVTGCLPFKLAVPNDSLYQYFIKSDYIEYWKKRMVDVSPNFMELFDNMVAFDYSQRPSISEIRQSAWMKEINYDLMPYLKQELILREEKIKYNLQKQEKVKQEIKNNNKEPVFSLLETKKQIKNIELINDNPNNINTINNSINKNDTNIAANKNKPIKKQIQHNKGFIKIKSRTKSLDKILLKIQRKLKKKGYAPIKQKFEIYELEVTDGEVDILLKIKKLKAERILIKYFKLRGDYKKFKLFRKEIKSLKAKFC